MLDGPEAVASAIGITKNGVLRWTYEAETGGYGDFVPPRHWGQLVTLAAALGKPLAIQDLMDAWAIRPPNLTSKSARTGAARPRRATKRAGKAATNGAAA